MDMEGLREMLDDLAHVIADATDEGIGTAELAALVLDLERLAGADLGGIGLEPVVLARRFARTHRILDRTAPTTTAVVERLHRQAAPVLQGGLACA